ncbi:helix-turn-helix domain-containing protein [Aquimarina agarilytica]|uniref:helix-turn-helix domain-containing protein n=1 Tax=Aquimarina agarilytica TaxID=1087449 RepID=UPI0002889A90|nr:helix-turn-helix domain-containing protein [Aquimarina agarilytica]
MDTNKEYNSLLISKIRIKRLELGLTQSHLANKIGISPITFSHIESGRREIKVFEVVKLCKYLNIKIDEVLEICYNKIKISHNSEITSNKKLKNKVISFTSFKGGMGVSTLSIILANEISKDYKLLFIDSHYQNSCYDKRALDLEVFPNIKPLYSIASIETKELAKYIDQKKKDYDYIIIDLPRFFYIPDYIEEITNQSDFVISPFKGRGMLKKPFKNNKDYLKHIAEGRLDLFIEYRNLFKNNDTVFSLIPFLVKIEDDEFDDYCSDQEIVLIPETFKEFPEHDLFCDTLNPISNLENAYYNPFIVETLKVIFHLKSLVGADLIMEDLKHKSNAKWQKILDKS